jgi:hypothetical protein
VAAKGNQVQLTDKLHHHPQTAYQTVGEGEAEEAIIINLTTGAYYSINDTGTMFWQLLDGQRTIGDCARLIAAEYDVEIGEVETDLLELAVELKKEGLLVA